MSRRQQAARECALDRPRVGPGSATTCGMIVDEEDTALCWTRINKISRSAMVSLELN